MKRRNIILIAILTACMAIAAVAIWNEIRTGRQMRAALEQALEQNRNYEPFTSDSLMRRVVAYYDHPLRRLWTSPNDRLRAGYALGCVYRDLHEAPIAIITWEDAIAAADTTAADCDFATLFRVYGQMASIYFRQYMPEKELEARESFCKYALLAGDTLSYIRGLLSRNDTYLSLGDTVSVYENTECVRHMYLERSLTKEAAQVYPSAIHIALDKGEYEKADSMMQIYEKESGLFDSLGNIAPTREIYYYRKGIYYLGIHKLDSAAIQFRRLLNHEQTLVDAYRGLLAMYKQDHKIDSMYKYSVLYEGALGNYLKNTKIDAIAQAQGMYDFEKQTQKANAEEQKAKSWRIGGLLATLLTSIVALIIYLYYRATKEEKKRKEQELRHVTESYNMTLEHLNKAQEESQILQRFLSDRDALEKLSKEKEEQVVQLETMVENLHAQLEQLQDEPTRLSTKESKVVSHFQFIVTGHYAKAADGKKIYVSSRCATGEEWNEMLEMFQECRPNLYVFLRESQLPDSLIKICILSRYGFNNSDISTLTGLDTKYVSNIRTKLAKEVFNLNSAYELNKYLIGIQ